MPLHAMAREAPSVCARLLMLLLPLHALLRFDKAIMLSPLRRYAMPVTGPLLITLPRRQHAADKMMAAAP